MQVENAPREPVLITERLFLRPLVEEDASCVQVLAGDERISRLTLNIPHPYKDGLAEAWIQRCANKLVDGTGVTLAVTEKQSGDVLGAVNVEIDPVHSRGEIGYWIGVPYWGRGYATEAAKSLVRYVFIEKGLHRIQGRYLACNIASGCVLTTLGFHQEGVLRQHDLRPWGFEDVVICGLLKADWQVY